MKTTKPRNYINNKHLYLSMIQHLNAVKEAESKKQEKPEIPRYIGESIILICNNLAKKPNFSGYTYKLDMISDGMVDCIAAVENFDPEKTNNPFAYFTQIAWNAFLRRIHKEKKQTYIKHKNFENSFVLGDFAHEEVNTQLMVNEYSSEIIKSFENKLTKVKKPAKVTGVEKFIGEN